MLEVEEDPEAVEEAEEDSADLEIVKASNQIRARVEANPEEGANRDLQDLEDRSSSSRIATSAAGTMTRVTALHSGKPVTNVKV